LSSLTQESGLPTVPLNPPHPEWQQAAWGAVHLPGVSPPAGAGTWSRMAQGTPPVMLTPAGLAALGCLQQGGASAPQQEGDGDSGHRASGDVGPDVWWEEVQGDTGMLSDLGGRRKGDHGSQAMGCGRAFAQSSGLAKHRRVHTGERPHPCPECGRRFGKRSNLAVHRRAHTGERPFPCPACPKAFARRADLAVHGRTHTGERPYHCADCGKGFSTGSNLAQHRRTHQPDRPYRCTQCGKGFPGSSELLRHWRSHTGERPYHCGICGLAFAHSTVHRRHQRAHLEESPYRCRDCGRSFAQRSDMVVHGRTHTGERPYRCPDCPKAFAQSSHLATHRRSHTGERPYRCPDCPKAFAQSSALTGSAPCCAARTPVSYAQLPSLPQRLGAVGPPGVNVLLSHLDTWVRCPITITAPEAGSCRVSAGRELTGCPQPRFRVVLAGGRRGAVAALPIPAWCWSERSVATGVPA
uniref:C2H2-type domain-containing protein n=1 Tax=Chrysemys picta bellii TaxID=8478 RepID=A0A8C3FY84_CHRPI